MCVCTRRAASVCEGEAGDPQVTWSQLQEGADPLESGDQQIGDGPKAEGLQYPRG